MSPGTPQRGASGDGADLARHFGFENDRLIRIAIRELIGQGHLIAASNHEPMGFYMIATEEEARLYEATLRSRALRTLERLRDFRRAAGRHFGPTRQMPLPALEPMITELGR